MEFTFIGLILSDLFGIKELGLFDELMGILFFYPGTSQYF